jgi:hypothetical protein
MGRIAPAATIQYTSAAAFAAATSNQTTIGFSGIVPAGASFMGFNPLVISGVRFATPLANTLVNVTRANFTPNNYPADFIVDSANPSPNNTLTISLAAATSAFALDFGGLGFSGASSATITLSNGNIFSANSLPTVGNTRFVGFVSADSITTLTLLQRTILGLWKISSELRLFRSPARTACLGSACLR